MSRERITELERELSEARLESLSIERQLHIATRHRDTYRELVKHLKGRLQEESEVYQAVVASYMAQCDFVDEKEADNKRLKERYAEVGLRAALAEDDNKRLREGLQYIANIGCQLDEPDKPIDPASRLVRAVTKAQKTLGEDK